MNENEIEEHVQLTYGFDIKRIISYNNEYDNHYNYHQSDEKDGDLDDRVQCYRIIKDQDIFYELYCMECRETMISFERTQSPSISISTPNSQAMT